MARPCLAAAPPPFHRSIVIKGIGVAYAGQNTRNAFLGRFLGIPMELEWGADGPHATSPILMDGGWHFLLCSHGTPVTGVEVVYTAQPPALYEYGRGVLMGRPPQWDAC